MSDFQLLRECIIDGKNSFVHSYIINPDGGDVLIKSEMKFGLCQLTNYLCFLKLMNSISKTRVFKDFDACRVIVNVLSMEMEAHIESCVTSTHFI